MKFKLQLVFILFIVSTFSHSQLNERSYLPILKNFNACISFHNYENTKIAQIKFEVERIESHYDPVKEVITMPFSNTLIAENDKDIKVKEDGVFDLYFYYNNKIIKGNYVGQHAKIKLIKEIQDSNKLHTKKATNNWPHGKGKFSCDYFSYEGDWLEGKMHGKGHLVIDNTTFNGDFFNNEFTGKGSYFEDKLTYEGSWKNFKMHGLGKMFLKDAYQYEGYFKENIFNGKGKLIFNSHSNYDGDFVDGIIEGKGTYNFIDNTIVEGLCGKLNTENLYYEGDFKTNCIYGNGILHFQNGDSLKGIWNKNQFTGNASLSFYINAKNKTCINYNGFWENNNWNGKGILRYQNGDSLIGNWVNNQITGEGSISFDSQEVPLIKYVGGIKNDKLTGVGTGYFNNGDILTGKWEDAKFTGKGKVHFEDNSVYEGDFINSVFNGKGLYYDHRDTLEGIWEDDIFTGYGIRHYTDNLVYKGQFVRDTFEGQGFCYSKVGDFQKGFFVKGILKEGTVKYITNEFVLEGQIKNFNVFGNGKISFFNGRVFEGEWQILKQNEEDETYIANGKGKMTYPNNNVLDGVFNANQFVTGILRLKDKSIYEGEIDLEEGVPNGKGKLTLTNKVVLIGKFENGLYIKPFECKTTKIGNQIWMAENLNVSKFRNGEEIIEAKTVSEWRNAFMNKIPAWCYFNNNPENGKVMGKLYNYYAVVDNRKLAPEGWRVASFEDVSNLFNSIYPPELVQIRSQINKKQQQGIDASELEKKLTIGFENLCKTKSYLRLLSNLGWKSSGNNLSGFNAYPSGYRDYHGRFLNAQKVTGEIGIYIWSQNSNNWSPALDYVEINLSEGLESTETYENEIIIPTHCWSIYEIGNYFVDFKQIFIDEYLLRNSEYGFSVRCIKQ